MAIDASHQQRFPLSVDTMNNNYHHHTGVPHFTNPWASSSQQSGVNHQNSYLQQQQQQQTLDLDLRRSTQQQQQQHYLPQPSPQHQHQAHHQQQHSPSSQSQQSPINTQHNQHAHRFPAPQHVQNVQNVQNVPKQLPLGQQPLPPPAGVTASSMAYSTSPLTVTAPPPVNQRNGSFVDQRSNMLSMPHDVLNGMNGMNRMNQGHHSHSQQQQPLSVATTSAAAYTDAATAYSSPSPIHPASSAYVTSGGATPYDQMGYAPATSMRSGHGVANAAVASYGMDANSADAARRFSQPDASHMDNRRNFQDAIEASQGIISLSQDTPRPLNYRANADGSRSSRGSGDSYGFPTPHSASSSI